LLAQEHSPEGLAAYARQVALFDSMDREDIAPSAGLTVRKESFTSAPDVNTVRIQTIRPEGNAILPCIYYIHGGRMRFSSCYEGNYKSWGRVRTTSQGCRRS
jgi:acetyl esterase